MAFTTAFFLTPRVWITDARVPSQREIPVDSLEQSHDNCLWCDAPASTPEPCDEEHDGADSDLLRSEVPECESEDERTGTGPNA